MNWLLPELVYVYPCNFEVCRLSLPLRVCKSIFRVVKNKSCSDAKPYQHPVVASIVREAFFKGSKSFASRNPDVFTSSLPSRDEKEIPAAMLALVGTAVGAPTCFAINDTNYCIFRFTRRLSTGSQENS